MESLATTAPTDPDYPRVVAAAQANAASRIQLRSAIWSQIYAVLTPAQQAQIPGLVAAEKANWEKRRAAWHSQQSAS